MKLHELKRNAQIEMFYAGDRKWIPYTIVEIVEDTVRCLCDSDGEYRTFAVDDVLNRARLKPFTPSIEEFESVMTMLAQGVINIVEGENVIERDSRVHKAMSKIVEMWQRGELALVALHTKRSMVMAFSADSPEIK